MEIETIVAQALDDLEAERLDLPDALRLAATIAWYRGHDEAEHHRCADPQPSAPDNGSPTG
jgi:hypothetical protein